MKIISDKRYKAVMVGILGFINAIAIAYYTSVGDTTSYYIGTKTYGWNPACIAFFAIDCIMLWRFFDAKVLNNKRRVVTALILGAIFSYTSLWGTHMLYGTNAIFDGPSKIICGVFAPLGFMLIIAPMFSELIGLTDALGKKTSVMSTDGESVSKAGAEIQSKTDSETKRKTSGFLSKADSFFDKYKGLYFAVMFLIFFLEFGILFLAYWPGSFSYDAAYQLNDYLSNTMSTHHPILSTLLIGKAYAYGVSIGNVNLGYSLYTIFQMVVLASSFAFFMLYLKCYEARKVLRVIAFIVFLNPVNTLFAISTVKGVLCAAFTIYALTALMFWVKGKLGWLNAIVFVISMILACQFRNNMIYAFVVAGVIIAAVQPGIRKKLVIAVLVLSVFAGNKVMEKGLIAQTNATVPDNYRESLSVPLMCIARVMKYHKDEIPRSEFERMTQFIPEYSLEGYSIVISDGIKERVDENALRGGIKDFVKLWIKYGLKYPGDYIEQLTGMTIGYWYPLDEPEFVNGSTRFYTMAVIGEHEQITNSNLTFISDDVIQWLNNGEGRTKIPLLGWLWRGTVYFWSFAFAFAYSIYAKRKSTLVIILIPFMYMLTCMLGPVSWIRYIYINVACLPMAVYSMLVADKDFFTVKKSDTAVKDKKD